jgi:hypothetical protein
MNVNKRAERTIPANFSASEQNTLYRPSQLDCKVDRHSNFCSLTLNLAGVVFPDRSLILCEEERYIKQIWGNLLISYNRKILIEQAKFSCVQSTAYVM